MSDVLYIGRKDAEMIQSIMHSVLGLDAIKLPARPGTGFVVNSSKPVYKLGGASIDRLGVLIGPMRDCVLLAITITTQDFTVFEVARTEGRQLALVSRGQSRTMQSKHLKQSDGTSHACDLVPWIGGKAVWDWGGCAQIAYAMDQAATQLGIANRIRWGGAWDRVLSDFGGTAAAYMAEVEAYKTRHSGKDFIDGPHFEWVA